MLPLNFHLTFVPERRLITSLLEFAALGGEGSNKEISKATGIPMGETTGKLPAILSYSVGMGLMRVSGSQIKRPILTPFGQAVYEEDRFLSEELTQWLLHFNLCRNDIGATVWNAYFANSMLGSGFTKDQLETYLVTIFGIGRNRTGPLISAYTDDAALSRAGVLQVDGNIIHRQKAPIITSYVLPYSIYILSLLEDYFPEQGQVTVKDFNAETQWFDICFWGEVEYEQVLTMLELTGNISIDRQMRPWIIERKNKSKQLWSRVWDDIA